MRSIEPQELFLRHVVEVLGFDPSWLETTPNVSLELRQALVSTCEMRVHEEQLVIEAAHESYREGYTDNLPEEAARKPQERIASLEALRSVLASLECVSV